MRLNRYRGVLLGALMGDCIGLKFEGCPSPSLNAIDRHFALLHSKPPNSLPFSDDSAMTFSVSKSLIERRRKLDCVHLAKLFGQEFNQEPDRGYGPAAFGLLPKLASDSLTDPFSDAAAVFNGTGSYGNGGAMRTSPIALFASDLNEAFALSSEQARVTHAHVLGMEGAALLTIAVKLVLDWEELFSDEKLTPSKFITELIERFEPLESAAEVSVRIGTLQRYYSYALGAISALLKEHTDELKRSDMQSIVSQLGNEITAHRSVPLAIFIFLQTLDKRYACKLPSGEEEWLPPFCNALAHALAFGGDTDTIGSMCGALCGAYYGTSEVGQWVPKHWVSVCEGHDRASTDAEALYHIYTQRAFRAQ